jgi:hypothetical protein
MIILMTVGVGFATVGLIVCLLAGLTILITPVGMLAIVFFILIGILSYILGWMILDIYKGGFF